MGIIWAKIFPPKEDNSAAVKKQAEGASNPMYALASLVSSDTQSGGGKDLLLFREGFKWYSLQSQRKSSHWSHFNKQQDSTS